MDFLWRDVLWLLLLLPALVAAYAYSLRRRKSAVRYSSLALMRDALAPGRRIRPHVPPLLLFLALVALLIAAARPVTVMTLSSAQRTIVLAIDVSYSMSATDIGPPRIQAAQAAAKDFVRAQPSDVRVGIVAFAGEADMVQRPTTERADALAAIDALQLNYHTAIGSGMIASLMTLFPDAAIGGDYDIFGTGRSPQIPQRLARNEKPTPRERLPVVPPASYSSAAIVLLTDGRETIGVSNARAAEIAADHGVRIYTVGFGSIDAGASIDMDGSTIDVGFDEQGLKDIAQTTRAAYFHASTAEELHRVYKSLNGQIVLERKQREITGLLTALGAVLALSAAGLSLAWSARIV